MDCFVASLLAMTRGEGTMIDHVSVGVADLERAARFYEAALAGLGLTRLVTRPATVGFGKAYPEFWINLRAAMSKVPHESGTHICLRAKTTAEVDAFHAAAVSNGDIPAVIRTARLKPARHFRRHLHRFVRHMRSCGAQARQDVLDPFGLEHLDRHARPDELGRVHMRHRGGRGLRKAVDIGEQDRL